MSISISQALEHFKALTLSINSLLLTTAQRTISQTH